MQRKVKKVFSIVILSIALTSTSSAVVGTIVKKGVQECIKRGCVQKSVNVIKKLVGKGAKNVKENPISSGLSFIGFAQSASADDDLEEVTTINNESNRTLDLLKMER